MEEFVIMSFVHVGCLCRGVTDSPEVNGRFGALGIVERYVLNGSLLGRPPLSCIRSGMEMIMLTLEHISYEVDGKKILEDIDLTIEDRFVAVTGPNGSGKSTLAKIIMGICQPTSGKIYFDGRDITGLPVDERANMGISYAFQQPVRFKGLRVRDLLELSGTGNDRMKEACDALSEVGLCAREYLDRELNPTLSGGEMKRIEIAMTAARKSKLSIFDEPEAGIDLWSFQSLIRVFEKIYGQTEGSVVIISHQERILAIADKIVYLADGRIEKYGQGEEILKSLQIRQLCSALSDKI